MGITGSIAAYKAIYLVRMLVREGAEVKVILSPAASDFVSPLTLSTLSRNPVLSDLFDSQSWSNHVMLGRWADLMLVAPLSCNSLAKMAHGHCDNLLMAVYLSATCPVAVAPAMDEDMWHHPATRQNLETIRSFGNRVIPVGTGELASGLEGEGRMAEPEEIIRYITDHFFFSGPLKGKKALVTAGPTYEPLDPVRFIGNHSSGKMGVAVAEELCRQGAEVTLILGPSSITGISAGIKVERVTTAEEMYASSVQYFPSTDITIMAAAVADYRPVEKAREKIKKSGAPFTLELAPTRDILRSLGEMKKPGQVLVGFALETTDGETYAAEKLTRKNADMIVLNSLQDKGAGFGLDTNKITIFEKNGQPLRFDVKSKNEVARDIVETIIRYYYA